MRQAPSITLGTKEIITGVCIFLVLILALCLTGCSDEYSISKIQAYIAQVKLRKPMPISPMPKVAFYKPIVYQAADLRDPFSRYLNQSSSNQPDMNRPKGPLELVPLDSIKMVGTISRNNVTWAILRTPDGNIYTVSVGTYVGLNYGKIVKITPTETDIQETIQEVGGWKKREAILKMLQ